MLTLCLVSALFFNATKLSAEAPPACDGQDLLLQLESTKPDEFAALVVESRKEINQDGVLWRLTREGRETSYLLGTFHSTDPRITTLAGETKAALSSAKTVAFEIADLNPKLMQQYVAKNPKLFFLVNEPTLDKQLSAEDYAKLVEAGKAAGMPSSVVKILKPWFATVSFFAVPGCERLRMNSGLEVLDGNLSRQAQAMGKNVVSLETIADQFSAFASLDKSHQMTMLLDGIHNYQKMKDIYVTSIRLYRKRQLGLLRPFSNSLGRDKARSIAAANAFNKVLLTKRNNAMFEKALRLTEKESSFIAIGALHLTGKSGLVELYRQAGYTVTKIN